MRLFATANHGDHVGTANLGQLHQRRTDTARGTGHQKCLPRRQCRPVEHVFGREVRRHEAGQLMIGQRRGDDVGVFSRHTHPLGKATVTLAAQVGGVKQTVARCAVKRGVDHDALAQTICAHAHAHRHDAADDVGALDTREAEGTALPARLLGCAVGAFAGPDVGVVDAAGTHLDQHLAGRRLGPGHIGAVLQLVVAAVAGQQHGAHG